MFVTRHKGDIFEYDVSLNAPVPPGKSVVLNSSGTEESLVKPASEPGTFRYHMNHWPAVNAATRCAEVHRLPKGAELLSKGPADLVETRKDGRIELCIDRTIPQGGSLEVSYTYRLPPLPLLDAHVPDGEGKFPVAIIVHGGGGCHGDKEADLAPVLAPVATNFTWFTINYRLAPTNRWPACFDDVQTAIRWVKQHAAEFKGDPDRIALLGYSAGGQLAALAAMSAKKDTPVQAVVGFAPPTDLVADAQRRGGLDKWSSMTNLLWRCGHGFAGRIGDSHKKYVRDGTGAAGNLMRGVGCGI